MERSDDTKLLNEIFQLLIKLAENMNLRNLDWYSKRATKKHIFDDETKTLIYYAAISAKIDDLEP